MGTIGLVGIYYHSEGNDVHPSPLHLAGKDVLKRDKKTAARTRTRRRESTESPTKKQCMPNVLITGTPGTGKTRLSALIAEKLGLKHIDGGNTVIQAECYSGLLNANSSIIYASHVYCPLSLE